MAATGIVGGDPNKLNKAGYSKGAIVAADATGTLTTVPIGSAAEVLTVDLTAPEDVDWVAPSGGGVSSFNSRTGAVLPASGDYAKGDVGLGSVDNTSDANKPISTAQQTALNLKANLASPTFTGTVTASGRVVVTSDVLTDAATIAVDASLGNRFRVLLTAAVGATRILGTPTSPTDGQMITIEVIQSATGSNALTFSAGWGFGTDITGVTLSTANNKHDFIGAIYNSTTALWYVIAFVKGY